jgi:hypothetical protein
LTTAIFTMGNFREEQVWREARLLAAALYQLTESFPAELASRIRSACFSLLDSLTPPDDLSRSRRKDGTAHRASLLAEQLHVEIRQAYERGLMERSSFSDLQEESRLLRELLHGEPKTQP